MSDPYANFPPNLDSPATSSYAVTPNDTTDLTISVKAIYVGVTGDIKVELVNDAVGDAVVLKAVPVGLLKIRARRIWATGTTATNIIGLY